MCTCRSYVSTPDSQPETMTDDTARQTRSPRVSRNARQPLLGSSPDDSAQQALKMEALGRLSAGIAHDFNNLLTDHPVLRRAHRRPLALGRARPRLDLSLLVANMLPMLRRVIGEDIQLHSSVDVPGLIVFADPNQIEQVVMNLVVNARDAMPRGGRLAITLGAANPPHRVRGGYGLDQAHGGRHRYRDGRGNAGESVRTVLHHEASRGGNRARPLHGRPVVASCGGQVGVASTRGSGTVFSVFLPRTSQSVTADAP